MSKEITITLNWRLFVKAIVVYVLAVIILAIPLSKTLKSGKANEKKETTQTAPTVVEKPSEINAPALVTPKKSEAGSPEPQPEKKPQKIIRDSTGRAEIPD